MRLCIDKEEAISYLERAHLAVGNMHLSPKQTLKRIKQMGVHWPTMYKDVHAFVRECTCQRDKNPIVLNAITLYNMSQVVINAISLYNMSPVAPKWAEAMVEYMTTNVMPEKISKFWQRYL